ncbi:MAG: hypothetical protein KJ985_05785, partial [Proteobacteria bacterium]|nr:hypothetical protein [Pseudomonadota bacterium]
AAFFNGTRASRAVKRRDQQACIGRNNNRLLCLCSAGVAIQYRNWQQAVIIAPDTGLLISPFDGAGSTGAIEEGRLIRIIKRHDSYALINDENGRSGWVPDSSFAFIAMIMADNKKPL